MTIPPVFAFPNVARQPHWRYGSDMPDQTRDIRREIAEATQRALVAVALQAYEEAGLSGLCGEGRWEVALGAIRSYDVRTITEKPAL